MGAIRRAGKLSCIKRIQSASMDKKVYKTLLLLIREGLEGNGQLEYDSVKWEEVINIASAHGLSAIAFDGIEKALNRHSEWRNKIPKSLLMPWYGQCVQQTALFKKNWSAACSLASLLGEQGIEAVVLKGSTIAQYYPIPEHRYSCDLDLFVAGDDWERAFLRRRASLLNVKCTRK